MATPAKFYCFTEDVAEQKHNLATDQLKLMLTNVAPIATNTVFADITDIAAGNGYTAGGEVVTVSSSSGALGVYKLVLADVTWTCVTAPMATFRYLVLYNNTHATKPLIYWVDRGSAVTLAVPDTFLADYDAGLGAITLT